MLERSECIRHIRTHVKAFLGIFPSPLLSNCRLFGRVEEVGEVKKLSERETTEKEVQRVGSFSLVMNVDLSRSCCSIFPRARSMIS
jgi:hypothetical protein